jgi:hypothetical protein
VSAEDDPVAAASSGAYGLLVRSLTPPRKCYVSGCPDTPVGAKGARPAQGLRAMPPYSYTGLLNLVAPRYGDSAGSTEASAGWNGSGRH